MSRLYVGCKFVHKTEDMTSQTVIFDVEEHKSCCITGFPGREKFSIIERVHLPLHVCVVQYECSITAQHTDP